jgi:hypothetical protein
MDFLRILHLQHAPTALAAFIAVRATLSNVPRLLDEVELALDENLVRPGRPKSQRYLRSTHEQHLPYIT